MRMNTNLLNAVRVDHVGVRDRGDAMKVRVPHDARRILGLPVRIAYLYACLMMVGFIAYAAWWRQAPLVSSDSGSYMRLAQDLTDLRIDSMHDRTPGYPLLLLLTGSSHEPTRILFYVSLVMYFSTIWMLGALLHSAGVPSGALIAFAVVLLLPPYVEPTATMMTETLTQFVLIVGFMSVIRHLQRPHRAWLAVASCAFGYAALTRPTYQLLPVAVGIVIVGLALCSRNFVRPRRAIRTAFVLLVGAVVLVGSYSVLNYRWTGYLGQTPFLGYNLSTRTVKFVERLPDKYAAVREVLIKHRDAVLVQRGSGHGGYNYFNEARRHDLTAVTGLSGVPLANYMFHINLVLIREAPLQVPRRSRESGRVVLVSELRGDRLSAAPAGAVGRHPVWDSGVLYSAAHRRSGNRDLRSQRETRPERQSAVGRRSSDQSAAGDCLRPLARADHVHDGVVGGTRRRRPAVSRSGRRCDRADDRIGIPFLVAGRQV